MSMKGGKDRVVCLVCVAGNQKLGVIASPSFSFHLILLSCSYLAWLLARA